MKKLFLHLSAALCLLTACNDAPLVHEEAQVPPVAAAPNAHAISMEQALANLDAFLTDGNASRNSHRTVSNVKTVKYAATRSRAEADAVDCDNLLYVANFADNQGYAILAADDRIPEPVLAVTELGSLRDSVRVPGIDHAFDYVLFPDYPATGPGLFTEPEHDDEVLLNPNTIDLHKAVVGDTLVGYYDATDYGAVTLNGDPMDANLELGEITQVVNLCVFYAVNKVKGSAIFGDDDGDDNGDDRKDNNIADELGGNEIFPDDGSKNNNLGYEWNGDNGNTSNSPIVTKHEISNPVVDYEISPMLSNYRRWYELDDYNKFYPEKRAAWIFGKKRKAPAGSAVLAIAKTVAFHKRPSTITLDNIGVDWSAINSNNDNTDKRSHVARLLRRICIDTKSDCKYQGTYTGVKEINKYLTSVGYRDVERWIYNTGKVITMLKNGKPVIVMGQTKEVNHCYTWNIDGYRLYKYTITEKTYRDGNLIQTTLYPKTTDMLHCTFGRGGFADGYYVSGIFKINSTENVYDDPSHDPTRNRESTNFNKDLRIVTYNK